MKAFTWRVLSLVILLTQAAVTLTGPSFRLCINPQGNLCFDALWAECSCCQDADAQEDEGIDDGCQCSHCETKPSLPEDPASTLQRKPCRCTHVPLVAAQDAEPTVSRPLFLFAAFPLADHGPVFRIESAFLSVNILPHPPPAHLLAIACTVLHC